MSCGDKGDDAVTVLIHRLVRVYLAASMKSGLRPAQWDALRYFAMTPRTKRSITGLAKTQATTKGTASLTVSSLVKAGLLQRTHGNRNIHIEVTPRGQDLLDHADPIRSLYNIISSLSEDDLADLHRIISKILKRYDGEYMDSDVLLSVLSRRK